MLLRRHILHNVAVCTSDISAKIQLVKARLSDDVSISRLLSSAVAFLHPKLQDGQDLLEITWLYIRHRTDTTYDCKHDVCICLAWHRTNPSTRNLLVKFRMSLTVKAYKTGVCYFNIYIIYILFDQLLTFSFHLPSYAKNRLASVKALVNKWLSWGFWCLLIIKSNFEHLRWI